MVSIALGVSGVLLAAPKAWARVFLSQEEALKKAFPDANVIKRKTLFLDDRQVEKIEAAARARMTSRVITYYQAWEGGRITGTAYFDTQIVRTMPMTFMALVKPDGTLGLVEILSFYEPQDYLPRPAWLRVFAGKALDDKLRLRWEIPSVTGSSLTCQAMTDGVRRLLAVHRVAVKKESAG
ncbi:MAG: hypothetical protein A2992_02775 [Elusimicrobia bacterium RIFCSPLOWO2_01_FULL_59_12]|nr:MAG: hypothetical protein A2992_02775 [Elusimicrobia bacterium RIFCSPLOWO2_01_FULL_59_12]